MTKFTIIRELEGRENVERGKRRRAIKVAGTMHSLFVVIVMNYDRYGSLSPYGVSGKPAKFISLARADERREKKREKESG